MYSLNLNSIYRLFASRMAEAYQYALNKSSSLKIKSTITLIGIVVIFSLFLYELFRPRILLMETSIPTAITDIGYSPNVAVQRIVGNIHEIYVNSRRVSISNEGLDFIPLNEIYDFEIPATKISFQSLSDFFRSSIGIERTMVYTDVVCTSMDCDISSGYLLRTLIKESHNKSTILPVISITFPLTNEDRESHNFLKTNSYESPECEENIATHSRDEKNLLISCIIDHRLYKAAEQIVYEIDPLSFFAHRIYMIIENKITPEYYIEYIDDTITLLDNILRPSNKYRATLLYYRAQLLISKSRHIDEEENRLSYRYTGYRYLSNALDSIEYGDSFSYINLDTISCYLFTSWPCSYQQRSRAQLQAKILNRLAVGYRDGTFEFSSNSRHCTPDGGSPVQSGLECAINLYRKALSLDEKNHVVHNNIAFALRRVCTTESLEESEHHYNIAINLNNDYARAYNNMAVLWRYANKPTEEAEKFYELAIESDPEYGLAHQNYAFFLQKNGRIPEALYRINMARYYGRDSRRFHLRMAQILARSGRYQDAEIYLEENYANVNDAYEGNGDRAIYESIHSYIRAMRDGESVENILSTSEWQGDECADSG